MRHWLIPTRSLSLAAILLVTAALVGCVHYQIGNRSLYRPDIRTVHVPIFTSLTYRRDLGERITEAVIKEIEATTPYKVTDAQSADSVLRGSLVNENKLVQGQNTLDDPRILQENFQIHYEWIDQRGQLIRQPGTLTLAPVLMSETITATGVLYPEPGQSMVTAQQDAIDQFAREVVRHMQIPW
ncbi:LPS assembly lipoprotein LptE [Bremerella sp. P1]|uniref:LPS assembly lipoprotein LptE n=1 Tax=Bremerella sp. P1 TaxID=3026424 RepID=UPI002367E5E9|nr:LPS assembly lipoprotein LptE [Bremerella sp. P1]WDI40396.1 LPS assembly lipoprotein LptE [Bremerella sp. P1]